MSPYLSLLKHASVRTILLMATGSMSIVATVSQMAQPDQAVARGPGPTG
jgi:hypothetical protein